MSMFMIPADTKLDVIDYDMLVHVDARNWITHYTKEDKVYDNHDFIDYVSVVNQRDDNFPVYLKGLIRENKRLVVFRAQSNGKTWFAKVDDSQIEYAG